MKIIKLKKIQKHRIFESFNWPADLYSFSEKNLIYGWNGSGKTTLSNILRALEKRISINEGEVEIELNSAQIKGKDFSTNTSLPKIRVFNQEFISENVFTSTDEINPIFVLGEENIAKQRRIEELNIKLKENISLKAIEESKKHTQEKILDDFKKSIAKEIKDLLSSSGGNNSYNQYDKSKYQLKVDNLITLSDQEISAKVLSEQEFNLLKTKKEQKRKNKLSLLQFTYPNIGNIVSQLNIILNKTVISKVIDALRSDHDLSKWVENGLKIHNERDTKNCLFCDQVLPEHRLHLLECHFNDEYSIFKTEINNLSIEIQTCISNLEQQLSNNLPNKLELYDYLINEYSNTANKILKDIDSLKLYLLKLIEVLEQKVRSPFQVIAEIKNETIGSPALISEINSILEKHNRETDNFDSSISETRQKIEESLVAGSIQKYNEIQKNIDIVDDMIHELNNSHQSFVLEIHTLSTEIEEHKAPAVELTKEIQSYLGNNALSIEVKKNGYLLVRNGVIAKNLSEGEKTAIALLYFLKSLKDKSFSIKDDIVVIDDPISSLDSNSLYYAFGFIKECTKNCGQLFILTHSHPFFRLVKNWFHHLNRQIKKEENHKARFYMVSSATLNKSNSSQLIKLDKLLYKYESEYHYLFKVIFTASNSTNEVDLEQNYHLPNIARRLLEAFLSFKRPIKSGDLRQQLELVDFDQAMKTRMLRFIHVYSHNEQLPEPEHDPSILLEAKPILQDLLQLIKREDSVHFDQMKELIDL